MILPAAFWLAILSSPVFSSSSPDSLSEAFPTIRASIQHHLDRHFFPKTLRLIPYNGVDLDENLLVLILQDFQVPAIVGRTRPIVKSPDPRSLSTGRMKGWMEVFRYVTILMLGEEKGQLDLCLRDLKTIVNRRWERILVILPNNRDLKDLMFHQLFLNFVHKFIFTFDNPSVVWADPMVHNKGQLIPVPLTNTDAPAKRKVGGNLQGRHIRIAGYEMPPWCYYAGNDENGNPIYDGNDLRMIVELSSKFNYTWDLTYEFSYGYYWEKNESWTGTIGRVINAEMDITVGHVFDYAWDYGLDHTSPMNPTSIVFLTNHPRTELKWYAFLLPYSPGLWGAVIGITVFLGLAQFLVMYFLVHGRKMKYVVVDSATFLPYAMAMEQGLCDIPQGARYICLIWLLGCTVLSSGYKATLRENISFLKPDKVATTFDHIAERTDYSVWLYANGELERMQIKYSTNPNLQIMRRKMGEVFDIQKCLENVLIQYPGACIAWDKNIRGEAVMRFTVSLSMEPFRMGKDNIKAGLQTPCFQKDSPIVDAYQGIVEGMWEGGLMHLWEEEEIKKLQKKGLAEASSIKPQISEILWHQLLKDETSRRGLSMKNLWAVFAIIPLICIFALLTFGLERGVWWWGQKGREIWAKKKLERKKGVKLEEKGVQAGPERWDSGSLKSAESRESSPRNLYDRVFGKSAKKVEFEPFIGESFKNKDFR